MTKQKFGRKCTCHLAAQKYAMTGHAEKCPRWIPDNPDTFKVDPPDWSAYQEKARRSFYDTFVAWATDPFTPIEGAVLTESWARRYVVLKPWNGGGKVVWQVVQANQRGIVKAWRSRSELFDNEQDAVDAARKDLAHVMARGF
jgi:hypothetical protein